MVFQVKLSKAAFPSIFSVKCPEPPELADGAFWLRITFKSPAVNPSEMVEVIGVVVTASIVKSLPATSDTDGDHLEASDQFQSESVNYLFSPVMSDRLSAFSAIAEAAIMEYKNERQ